MATGGRSCPGHASSSSSLRDGDLTQAVAQNTRAAPDRFDVRHVWFAMRLVAKELDQEGVTGRQYTLKQQQLVKRQKRGRSGPKLEAVLPTAAQIEAIARKAIKAEREAGVSIADPE